MSSRGRLEKMLIVAVPMWVSELKDKPIESLLPRVQGEWPNSYSGFIGAYGDQILYGGPKAAEGFNKIAEGLAVLSMVCPGGVDFGDLHFEYPHKDLGGNS